MKKILIGALIVGAVALMIIVNVLNGNNESSSGLGFASGRTETVEADFIVRDTITSSILITGTVEEINKNEVISSTPLDIQSVLVDKGDLVQEGDPLFTIDIDAMKDELAQLEINYEIQALTMERLLSLTLDSDDTSMVVALSQARLAQESAQRYYDTQVGDLDKHQSMLEAGIISSSEYEAFQDAVAEAESQLASAKLSYQRSSADLTSVRKSNENADLSSEIDIKIQQMTMDSLQMNIEDLKEDIEEIEALTIAPMNGVVTALSVEAGEMTSSMEPLLVVTDVASLIIRASIREYDIKDVILGQEVLITGDAINKKDTVMGEVTYIAPVAAETIVNNRQVTGVEVEISVVEGVETLKPGYTTDCEVITSELVDVVVVSYEMLTTNDQDEDIVFVVNEEGKAEERKIELGASADFTAEVTSGLEAGDQVVINPSLSLLDGTKVEVLGAEEGE